MTIVNQRGLNNNEACTGSALSLFISIVTNLLVESKPKASKIRKQYDFIVVGGGTAGCVVANRLSEVPSFSVLLIEAGGEEPHITAMPGAAPIIETISSLSWNFMAEPQPESCGGQRCSIYRAKMLGGCSSHNFMEYNRGNKRCFDKWYELGNDGWSYRDVLPYFKKSENNLDPDVATDTWHHNVGGLLPVQRNRHYDQNREIFSSAFEELGFPLVDPNGMTQDGYTRPQFTVINGERMSANRAFLRPFRGKRHNLHVVINTMVRKVVVNPKTKKACGVEYISENSEYKIVHARKEVIVCAGVINSPKLLQLSGIGSSDILEPLNIPIIKNLDGVGQNFHDQVLTTVPLIFKLNQTSILPRSSRDVANDMQLYRNFRSGPLSGMFLMYAYTHTSHDKDNIPDIIFNIAPLYNRLYDRCPYSENLGLYSYYNSVQMSPGLVVIRSRGNVTINSKDPLSHPVIYLNYLKNEKDYETLVEGFVMAMLLSKTRTLKMYGITLDETPVPNCRHLKFGLKKYWQCALRGSATEFHQAVGTCKMGPRHDPEAVVDHRLKVHGIHRLRIVDASIMPNTVNAYTTAATIMIGEKGADMVKEDWNV